MTPALFELLHVWRVIRLRWGAYVLMVAGLLLSYSAAIFIGLYVRDELTFDRFLPSANEVFLVSTYYGPQGRALVASDLTPAGVARWMKTDLPSVEAVTRLNAVEWPMSTARRKVKERFYWADPNFFDVLPLPVLHGDLSSALRQPGNIVMTQRMARAYFGHDDVVGQTVFSKGNVPFTVTAVIRDLPANTHLDREIFVSGTLDFAMLSILDRNEDYLWPTSYTYARFKPGTSVPDTNAKLARMTIAHWRGPNNIPVGFIFIPILKFLFQPPAYGQMKPRGHVNSILALVVVAGAILVMAGINFSGLVLAETNERSSEMAIRRALGATRPILIASILREAVIVNVISAVLALAITERFLPVLNRSVDLNMVMWSMPDALLFAVTSVTLVGSLLSGVYPAVVVSRPLIGGRRPGRILGASERWRGWVTTQLALVIVLLIASHTMERQWRFATHDSLNFTSDKVLMVKFSAGDTNERFANEVRNLKGVAVAAESFGSPTTEFVRPALAVQHGGRTIPITRNSVHPDFFKVYHVPVLAGRNLPGTFLRPEMPSEVLVNLSAVKALGYNSPQAAIGQMLTYDTDRTRMQSRIIGVVPDLRFKSIYEPVQPMIFDSFSKYFSQLNVRLTGEDAAGVLSEIDRLWARDSRDIVPIERRFFSDYIFEQYHELGQQIGVFNLVAAVGILMSMLGLTGLSIFLTRHQVREMAVRRALGATFQDIFLQRLTPFLWPLFWANMLAWPIAWCVLTLWLNSFADHVTVSPVSFLGASCISIAFATATLATHSAMTIRAVHIRALRH